MINIIVAMDRDGLIGNGDKLPWNLPPDMKRFIDLTTNHTVIMGSKTHKSIGGRLKNRDNIVLSKEPHTMTKDCVYAGGIDAALHFASAEKEIFIIGGANVYEQLIPLADRMYITYINDEYVGDTYFPDYNVTEWSTEKVEHYPAGDELPGYSFYDLIRKGRDVL